MRDARGRARGRPTWQSGGGTGHLGDTGWHRDGGYRMPAKIVDDTSGLVSIGQLAKAAGVSSRTIRYYEELGILPEPRRSAGGTRKYPSEYSSYIAVALALKDHGFRLEEVKP